MYWKDTVRQELVIASKYQDYLFGVSLLQTQQQSLGAFHIKKKEEEEEFKMRHSSPTLFLDNRNW